ncbi:uncharacterized protein N7503_009892 [Penicillium pulvis]|uniref:uncharacterized protein n=1 Tax=Penicillium pulvis TaxID=1562058 RepID=UPI002546BC2A|nr:uncharacterized protein N7503_009892 [Penicillium pulvis]KAJ5784680.1 hypothetical protein N7503_009892 [Penicillium pulvis]
MAPIVISQFSVTDGKALAASCIHRFLGPSELGSGLAPLDPRVPCFTNSLALPAQPAAQTGDLTTSKSSGCRDESHTWLRKMVYPIVL